MTRRFRFRPAQRLRTRTDFRRVMKARCRASNGRIVVYAAGNQLGHSRLGISIGRRVGSAAARNHIKRLVREAFRLQQHDLPSGYDLVCVILRSDDATLTDYQTWLADLSASAIRQYEAQARGGRPGRVGPLEADSHRS